MTSQANMNEPLQKLIVTSFEAITEAVTTYIADMQDLCERLDQANAEDFSTPLSLTDITQLIEMDLAKIIALQEKAGIQVSLVDAMARLVRQTVDENGRPVDEELNAHNQGASARAGNRLRLVEDDNA